MNKDLCAPSSTVLLAVIRCEDKVIEMPNGHDLENNVANLDLGAVVPFVNELHLLGVGEMTLPYRDT